MSLLFKNIKFEFYKGVELVGGGSVINRASPSSLQKYICRKNRVGIYFFIPNILCLVKCVKHMFNARSHSEHLVRNGVHK